MELSQAKRFIYIDDDYDILYMSLDFWKLKELAGNISSLVMAICDTNAGEQVFEIDDGYDGEPIILRRFMHVDSFMKFYSYYKIKII